jgi:uncharacterized membrane protein SpoIIM required for sporulation
MNEQAFVEKREEDWQKLTRLCDIADAGASRLSGADVREFVKLYRRVSTDLAIVRTQSTNTVLLDFLNDIVGRAYATLYREPRPGLLKSIAHGAALAAQTVRRRKWFVITSVLLFFGSAFFSYFVLTAYPDTRDVLIPPPVEKLFGGWKEGRFEERGASESFAMTGFYAQNNPRVAIIAGAVGAGTFGILSVYMVFENGAMLGSLAHEVGTVGKLDFLVSSVAPHGVPELSGAIIGGAAGLLLGWALINPGRRSRSQALRAVGKDAIVLLATSVMLMFIAAPIEGFFSFNPKVPGAAKVIVAVVSLAGWLAFWGYFGLSEEERSARSQTP